MSVQRAGKRDIACALFLALLVGILSGCGAKSDGETANTNFMFSTEKGSLTNAEGKQFAFEGQSYSGDMPYTLVREGEENSPRTSIEIPYSRSFTLESGEEQVEFWLANDPIGMYVSGHGIEKAVLTDNSSIQLTGDMADFVVSLPLPEHLNMGMGKIKLSGGAAAEIKLETTKEGFRLAGAAGPVSLEISSTAYNDLVFLHGMDIIGPECSIDLLGYGDGLVRITENGTTSEVKVAK